jgi:hypothetical protein
VIQAITGSANVRQRGQVQVAVLARPKILPFILEDVAAGPAFLEGRPRQVRLAASRSHPAR